MRLTPLIAIACALPAIAASPREMVSGLTHRREHIGQCFRTTITSVETRLADDDGHGRLTFVPESGSAIVFSDHHYNVDYGQVPEMDQSKVGDPARLCVVHFPSGCPRGDTRGIVYEVVNLRTGGRWRTRDSEHVCGGA